MSEAIDSEKAPRAYAQWVIMMFNNEGTVDIKLKNLDVSWGKLHANGNKDKELPTSDFEGKVIKPGETVQMNACGREYSPSGTTGDFDMVDTNANDRVIRHFYWDCPWSSSQNTWTVSESNSKWMVESTGESLHEGALGTITTKFLNIPPKE